MKYDLERSCDPVHSSTHSKTVINEGRTDEKSASMPIEQNENIELEMRGPAR